MKGLEASEDVSSMRHFGLGQTFEDAPLVEFPAAVIAEFNGVGFRSLELLDAALSELKIWSSAISDISSLAGSETLEMVDFHCTLIEDLRPLETCPELFSLRVVGTPLDETNFYEVRPRLIERAEGKSAKAKKYDLEDDWKLMRELQALGLVVATYRWDGQLRVAATSLEHHPDPEVSYRTLGKRQILEVVESLDEMDTVKFLEACAEKKVKEGYLGDTRTFDKDAFIANGYRL